MAYHLSNVWRRVFPILASVFAWTLIASAQTTTVQPTLVRPYKGAADQVFAAPMTTLNEIITSKVIDARGFASLQIQYVPGAGVCGYVGLITVETSDSSNGTFTEVQDTANNQSFSWAGGASSVIVSNTSGYVRLKHKTTTASVCATNQVFSVTMLPYQGSIMIQGPLRDPTSAISGAKDYYPALIGGLVRGYDTTTSVYTFPLQQWSDTRAGGGLSVPINPVTPFVPTRDLPVAEDIILQSTGVMTFGGLSNAEVPFPYYGTSVILQNRSAIPINCGFRNTTTAPATDTDFAFTLPPQSGGVKGSSAPYELKGYNGRMWCAADSVGTKMSYIRR